MPRIFFSNTSYEYWGRAAALIHIAADGEHDAPISPNVRVYHFTGLQHFPGPYPPAKGRGDLLGTAAAVPIAHQIFLASDDQQHGRVGAWQCSAAGKQLPKIADGTLVPLSKYALPCDPGRQQAA